MLKIADEEHPDGLGFVSLWLYFAGGEKYYSVNWWLCGVSYGSEPHPNEVDARRAYDALRKELLHERRYAA